MRLIEPTQQNYTSIHEKFSWSIPEYFNIAEAVCDRHKNIADRIALYYENEQGDEKNYTFGEIKQLSNQLANLLSSMGVKCGDRIAIILSQRLEAAISHLAIYKLGAIAVPLSVMFGSDAVKYRLHDSGARLVILDGAHRSMVDGMISDLPMLEGFLDCDSENDAAFWSGIDKCENTFECVNTRADDPAILIYTSGTTGPAKGAVVAHRCLLGNLPGFELSHNFLPQKGDLFWTPADWAWTGGLIDALLPSWYYGIPILGYEGGKFNPERAWELIGKYRVRNAFIPPTALKMMRQVKNVESRFGVDMRTINSAGESMGAELFQWGKETLGIEINEMWAQTEFNYIVGNCSAILPVKPGSMGRTYPGHRVEPVDKDGNVMPTGEIGELAAHRDDPVMFLGYWNREEQTREKFIGDWWGTGDIGYRDEDGYLWFVGRMDDVISSAGYRIGPGEIEDCLLKHPAVAQAAAVGSPDEMRGEVVKAFIILAHGYEPTETLKSDIQATVKQRLATYEYPREIEFIDSLPLTTTGKVRRMELRKRERKLKGIS
ncbi:MAG: AMP-binding protein [Gammaproteobacteria bacterium]|nr:AMP-binding protein [Gammaproteobacteria bacterium]